jgi:hypothetical protein
MYKHYPPHLSQLVFGDLNKKMMKINGLDYDLFIFLIYQTHKSYSLENKDIIEIEYSKVKETLKSSPNTQSIKSSLQKIGNIVLKSNYLQSYGDKEIILTTKPFEIEIITSENGKSYGFSVQTSKDFLGWFDNPIPKVEVNYDIIFSLKKMAKLLYLFLKDSLGIYENKNRNVDIEKLKNMMNIYKVNYANSNFITEIKKSVADINENSDINVQYQKISHRNLKTGLSEIKSVKFIIQKGKLKTQTENVIKTKSTTVAETKNVEINNISATKTFEQHIEELVLIEYKKQISYGKDIANPTGYKNTIRKSLMANSDAKSKFELITLLDDVKANLKSKIRDGQLYQLVFTNGVQGLANRYYINNDYLLENIHYEIVTKSINETLNFIQQHNGENLYFDMARSNNFAKEKAGLINPDLFD